MSDAYEQINELIDGGLDTPNLMEFSQRLADSMANKAGFKTSERHFEMKKLRDLNHEIIRLAVTGMKRVDIAEALGVTSATVINTLESRIAQDRIKNLQASRDVEAITIHDRIQMLAPQALTVLEDLMHSTATKDNVRKDIAVDLLDRAGHAAVKKQEVRFGLSQAELDAVKQKALEIGRQTGFITDVDSEEVIVTNTQGE